MAFRFERKPKNYRLETRRLAGTGEFVSRLNPEGGIEGPTIPTEFLEMIGDLLEVANAAKDLFPADESRGSKTFVDGCPELVRLRKALGLESLGTLDSLPRVVSVKLRFRGNYEVRPATYDFVRGEIIEDGDPVFGQVATLRKGDFLQCDFYLLVDGKEYVHTIRTRTEALKDGRVRLSDPKFDGKSGSIKVLDDAGDLEPLCMECGRPQAIGDPEPPVVELPESAGPTLRRWKCHGCFARGIGLANLGPSESVAVSVTNPGPSPVTIDASVRGERPEVPEKFDEATGPIG